VSSRRAATASLIVALGVPATASGTNAAIRIVDRTLICPIVGLGYPESIRSLEVSARSRQRQYARDAPSASVEDTARGESGSLVQVGVRTAAGGGAGPQFMSGGVWLSVPGCTRTRLRVALSARGLRARPADRIAYRCGVPARVLIRIRAVFKRPTAFSRDLIPSHSIARGRISVGYLAVTTVRGRKPIFFGAVNDATGKGRGFIAPSRCRPEW
jgi:hypothetical protein